MFGVVVDYSGRTCGTSDVIPLYIGTRSEVRSLLSDYLWAAGTEWNLLFLSGRLLLTPAVPSALSWALAAHTLACPASDK